MDSREEKGEQYHGRKNYEEKGEQYHGRKNYRTYRTHWPHGLPKMQSKDFVH